MVEEDFATRDVDLAVVRQGHDLRPDELVEVVGERDAGQPLERLHAQVARVDEDLLVVERHLDPRLAVPVVVALAASSELVFIRPPVAAGATVRCHPLWGGFPGGSPASPLVTAAA